MHWLFSTWVNLGGWFFIYYQNSSPKPPETFKDFKGYALGIWLEEEDIFRRTEKGSNLVNQTFNRLGCNSRKGEEN